MNWPAIIGIGAGIGAIAIAASSASEPPPPPPPRKPRLPKARITHEHGAAVDRVQLPSGITMPGTFALRFDAFANQPPLVWTRPIEASKVIHAILEKKNVFRTPYRAIDAVSQANLRAMNDLQKKRYTIVVNSWREQRFFGTLLCVAWLMLEQGDEAEQIGDFILNWFYYHRWEIGPDLTDESTSQLVEFSCDYDEGLPDHQYRAFPQLLFPKGPAAAALTEPLGRDSRSYPAYYEGSYHPTQADPKVTSAAYCHDQTSLSVEDRMFYAEAALGDKFFGAVTTAGYAQLGPPGIILEYAAARYAMFSFVASVDGKAGEEVGKALFGAMSGALSTAIAGIGTLSAATSAVPIVGWAIAAVGAVITAFLAIFGAIQGIEKIQQARVAISDRLEAILRGSWDRYGKSYGDNPIVDSFSGYRANLLIPRDQWQKNAGWPVSFNDIKDPLWHHFCLVSDNAVHAVPQLPFFYLSLDFAFPASVRAVMNNWLVLVPIRQGGVTDGWQMKEMTFAEYGQLIANYFKQNPLL